MLDYNILNKKPTIAKLSDEQYVQYKDLLAGVYNKAINTLSGTEIVVNKYYVARPDLISLALYNTDKYADIICKVNGISNPFELNEDMVLFCPTMDMLNLIIKQGAKSDLSVPEISVGSNKAKTTTDIYSETANKYKTTTVSPYTVKEKSSISKNENSLKKKVNEKRSPGEQTINDNNYVIDKSLGVVIY